MSLKENLITQAIQKIKNSFSDNQGWVRQNKFTPVQQIQRIGSDIGYAARDKYYQTLQNAWSPSGTNYKATKAIQGGINNIANWNRVELPKPQVQNKIGQTAINLGYAIPESIINIPRNYLTGITRTGLEIANAKKENRKLSVKNMALGAAPLVESLVDVGTLGFGVPIKEAVKQGAKQTIKQAIVKQGLKGAGYGALGGTTYGLDKQYGKDFNAKEVIQSAAGGALLGGVLGAGSGAVGAIKTKLKTGYEDLGFNAKTANKLSNQHYVRTENTPVQFKTPKAQRDFQIKVNTELKRPLNTPVFSDDLKAFINKTQKLPDTELGIGMTVKTPNKTKVLTPEGKISQISPEVTRVADNIIKNNPTIGRTNAEAMAKDVIEGRKFNTGNLSPESKGINKIIEENTNDITFRKMQEQIDSITPKTDTVPPKGKIKTTLSETKGSVPTTKESQISSPQLSISKKGKLNTDKLNITPEQKAALDVLQENVPVTVIGNKEVIKKAKGAIGRKTPLTDEEMTARLAQQLASRQEVVTLSNQFEKLKQSGAGEVELLALKKKIVDQSRIAQQQGTFAGRLLQAQNILANEAASPEQKIYALLDNAGISEKAYLKDAINVNFNNAVDVVNFYRKHVPAKFGDVLTEVRYSNMLSSPLTQIVNTTSNLLQSGIIKPVEKTITGGLDFISSKLTGKERQYYASQGIDYAKGYWKSLPEAWKKFKTIASGKEISLRPDLEYIPATTKGPLKWYTTPLRVLEASDQFFRTLVQGGEKRSLARLNLPEAELAKRAAQSADYTLFRQKFDPSGELGQGVVLKAWDKWNTAIQGLRRMPGGNWILPFLQTPTNILKQGLEYSPLGVSTMIGAKRPLEQLSKALIGSAVFAGMYGLADSGGTTWAVPSGAKEKELFYASGLQPYSIKIGNKWVSYSKLGPLAYPMAMVSALKWVEKNNPDQNVAANLRDALGQMVGFFGDQSYVQSLGDVLNTIKGGNSVNKLASAVQGEFSNFVGQLVPYKSFQGWLTRLIDPTYRKPEGTLQDIMATTPGLSTQVPAYKDIYGNDSKRDLPLVNAISPFRVGVEKPEAKNLYDVQQSAKIQSNQMAKEKEKMGETGGTTKDNIYYPTSEGVKTLSLSKLDDIAKLPTTNKYDTAIKESKQFSAAATILDNTDLTAEQKTTALTRLGIDQDTAKYYQIANDNTNLKTMYVLDKVQGATDKNNVLEGLLNLRKQVNGQMIASNAVLDNLVDEGVITKSEATQLKKYKMENGKPTAIKKSVAKKATKIKVKKLPTNLKSSSSGKIKTIKQKAYKPIKFKVPKKLKVKKIAINKVK